MTNRFLPTAAIFAAAALFLTASIAFGQDGMSHPRGSNNRAAVQTTARPGVDCSLLTVTQAAGQPCANAPKPDVPVETPRADQPPAVFGPDCYDVNPYTPEGAAKANDCNARPMPDAAEPVFHLGGRYAFGYDDVTAVVIGIARDLDGVLVVTFRWDNQPADDVRLTAERFTPTAGGLTNFRYVGQAR